MAAGVRKYKVPTESVYVFTVVDSVPRGSPDALKLAEMGYQLVMLVDCIDHREMSNDESCI